MQTIRALREVAGMTQHELALAVGVQAQAVGLWERGQRMPNGLHLQAVARVLGVSADDVDLSMFEGKAAA